jgi:hypothetical protein
MLIQPTWSRFRYSGWLAFEGPAFPLKPQIEIENARSVSESRHNISLNRNSVAVNPSNSDAL